MAFLPDVIVVGPYATLCCLLVIGATILKQIGDKCSCCWHAAALL